jgi:hypothetical protein
MDLDRQVASLDIPNHIKTRVTNAMRERGLAPTLLTWAENSKDLRLARGIGPKTVRAMDAACREFLQQSTFRPRPHMRASALSLGGTCPGSVFLGQEATAKQIDTSTVYTAVGTLGHRWMEIACRGDAMEAWEYFGAIPADDPRHKVAEELGPSLKEFWRWMTTRYPLYGEVYTEVPVSHPVDPTSDQVAGTGTLDLVMVENGRIEVRDWKFYNNLSLAAPMLEDVQMLTYGVAAAAMMPNVEVVIVRRMLVYQCEQDELIFGPDDIQLAREALDEILHDIWTRRDQYAVGAHCSLRCFQRGRCPVYQAQSKNIETKEIAPYRGGLFRAADDVVRFLLGIKLVADRIDAGMEAAKEWVREHGAVEDGHGSAWGAVTQFRDSIVKPNRALGILMRETDKDTALAAAKTTKTALMDACRSFGLAPKEGKLLIEMMRDAGAIEKIKQVQWRWKKVKKESG